MKFTSDVVVLSARRYSMTDDKTGELVQGTKIEYVEDWDPQPQQNKRGLSVLSANFPYETFDRLGDVPAVYSADFRLVAGARGKPTVALTNLSYREPFKPFPKSQPGKPAGGAK